MQKWPADRVERRALAALVPYARNARTHSAAQVDQIAASMREWGWTNPVLVDEGGGIIAGHGRVLAALALGFTEAPVMVAEGWTDAQKRAYVIADNQLGLNAGWDMELLASEVKGLDEWGFDTKLLGFSNLDALMAAPGSAGLTDPDAAPEVPEVPIASRGQLWALGRHRLLCGNATNAADAQRVLAGAKPNLMVTDPPYGVEYDPAWRERAGVTGPGTAKGQVKNDDQADWREAWALFPGAVAYVWHGGLHAGMVERSLQACHFKLRAQIVWVKQRAVLSRGAYHWQHEPAWYGVREGADDGWRFVPEHEVAAYAVAEGATADWVGGRKQSTVWFIEHFKSSTGHGTQKPVECMRRPMINNSDAGDAVYDPFCGSGTSIIAAEMTGRTCHAIELNPAYIDVAVLRWQEFTGKQAVLDGDGRTFAELSAAKEAA